MRRHYVRNERQPSDKVKLIDVVLAEIESGENKPTLVSVKEFTVGDSR